MKGIVYCVECEDTGGKYIGSTTRKLNKRMLEHKNNVNQYDKGNTNGKCAVYDIIKNGNYKSYILEEVEYSVVNDLHKKELEYIEKTDCVNIMHPALPKSESDRRYRNGEKREEILQKKRDYAEENKEKIKEYRGQVIECECGGTYQLNHKAGHLKTLFHRRRVEPELIEKDNKEKEDRRKNTLEKNAKVVDCECGVSYTFGNRQRHFNSARHINYI